MKYLLINSVCGVGSTGRICVDIYHEQTALGNTCLIAYGRGDAPKDINTYKICGTFNNYIDAFKTRIFDNAGFNSTIATKKFIKVIKEFNPDVIHMHNIHGYFINIKVLFHYLKNEFSGRVIWTLHDCWSFTGHCSHFMEAKCDKWKTKCFKCPCKKEYPKASIFSRSTKNYKLKKELFTGLKDLIIITPSIWLKEEVEKSFLKEYQVIAKHNKIDLSSFKPVQSTFKEENHLENKKIILGVASVWSKKKGLYDFIELSKMLTSKFQIVLVGISQKQKKLLPETILAIEKTNSKEELAKIYSCADVFLNLSYEENYPTVNLEAKACGTKVVAYNVGGTKETISDETNLVDVGDLIKVKERITELC